MTLISLLNWFLSLRKLRHLLIQAWRLLRLLLRFLATYAQLLRLGIHRFRLLVLLPPFRLLLLLAVDAADGLARRLSLLGRALAFRFLIPQTAGGHNRPLPTCVLQRGSSR